ncbi:diguanylate cyclase (GGDEF) domain-containing protein [Paraburkholderia lycopersici]|uniref:diguanylate cyclase n=2 Tax=Paraburkholderia lycopersici TaxID=416944 RepID=A0A1G6PND4_9BURK|nr:diguanylate cyclase (GGDEF) domain-containing protein [Paraburkholderia lycopersici]
MSDAVALKAIRIRMIKLADLIPGALDQAELHWLAMPNRHWVLLSRRRAAMIVNRVRMLAFLFAVLTPLWSIVDLVVFPFPLWFWLAMARIFASVMFASLLLYRPNGELADAYQAMALLFAVPTVFFITSYVLLGHYHLSAISAAIASGYAFLPFVLVAGFSIFPLTLLENIVFASPVLMAEGAAGWMRWSGMDWPSFAGAFWLLVLIMGVSALAGISQLAFMVALVRQSIYDPLTGVLSRGSGEEMLDLQLALASRSNAPLTVVLIDIDHFKQVNDRFGHDAGDRVLKQFAHGFKTALRRGDILIRWGGEEFLLLMSNVGVFEATRALQRVREGGMGKRPDGSPLTASIGLAERISDGCDEWRSLVKAADTRMYAAKQRGRDCVVAAG